MYNIINLHNFVYTLMSNNYVTILMYTFHYYLNLLTYKCINFVLFFNSKLSNYYNVFRSIMVTQIFVTSSENIFIWFIAALVRQILYTKSRQSLILDIPPSQFGKLVMEE